MTLVRSRRSVALVVAVLASALVAGCGHETADEHMEKLQNEFDAAGRKLHRAEGALRRNTYEYIRLQQRRFRETGGTEVCAHLRAHQLHSSNPILAKEAREYLEGEC